MHRNCTHRYDIFILLSILDIIFAEGIFFECRVRRKETLISYNGIKRGCRTTSTFCVPRSPEFDSFGSHSGGVDSYIAGLLLPLAWPALAMVRYGCYIQGGRGSEEQVSLTRPFPISNKVLDYRGDYLPFLCNPRWSLFWSRRCSFLGRVQHPPTKYAGTRLIFISGGKSTYLLRSM